VNKTEEFILKKISEALTKSVYCELLLTELVTVLSNKGILSSDEIGEILKKVIEKALSKESNE